MVKRTEDHIRDEVRRRVASHHAAAGVPSSDIALEVLYLLPSEFVRGYSELFWMALGDPISPQGDGGKDEGRIKARGTSRSPMHTRGMPAAQAGKKFVDRVWPVRNEVAAKQKSLLDKKLVRAVEGTLKQLGHRTPSELRASGPDDLPAHRCGDCGQLMAIGWERCPYHPPT